MLPNLWKKLRCAVSVDWRMNTTGMYADYVLPVAHHFEKMAFMFPTPHLMNLTFSDKAVEPPPGVMAEVEMAVMLAEKIEERAKARGITELTDALGAVRPIAGLRNQFTMNGTLDNTESLAREWVSDAVESGNLPEGTSLDTLKEKGYMRFLNWGMGPMSHSQAADIKTDETHTAFTWHTEKKVPYPTLTRRAQFYIDHEWFMEADEALPCHKDNPPQGGDYPFVMTSGHNRWSIHSMNITNKTLLQTHRGRPHLVMNDSDAARLGIRDEEEVEVQNDLGTFIVPVKLSPSVRPNQVISYNGWEPYMYRTWKGARPGAGHGEVAALRRRLRAPPLLAAPVAAGAVRPRRARQRIEDRLAARPAITRRRSSRRPHNIKGIQSAQAYRRRRVVRPPDPWSPCSTSRSITTTGASSTTGCTPAAASATP